MSREGLIESIRERFPDAFVGWDTSADATLTVKAESWKSVAAWLAKEGGFAFLSDLCAVDYLDRSPRFEVVYQLTNMQVPERLCVRLPVDGDPPKAPSVVDIWPGADWPEREAFDMFGIVFEGHPALERILMPEEWVGHPLRKDYAVGKVPVEFKRISPGFS